jgi:anti-sigma regulatory factor (Ser/Thr protein kinase)
MSIPAVMSFPAILNYEAADRYLDELRQLVVADPGRTVELDWKNSARVDADAGVVISNALVGSLSNVRLIITLPSDRKVLDRLARAGLTFALANRPRETTAIQGADPSALDLPFWNRTWSRTSDVAPRHEAITLFAPAELGEEAADVEGQAHAAFVNAHLSPAINGKSSAAGIARPWLTRLLPQWRGRLSSPRLEAFLIDVNHVISELLDNVRQHALRRPDTHAPTTSLLMVALTQRKIYVSVQDNGPGIAETARCKIEKVDPQMAAATDAELVAALLEGTVSPWDRGRNMGLPQVVKAARGHQGTLRVATREVRLSTANGLAPSEAKFDLLGTAIIATMELPSSRDADR